ncbi:hypothetical protein DE146DRAFT_275704 [Phaeosphaeria sp. MPI-PUGE-AT-0046c]|nr:hypothetical protein DE146DRAFT_275704 [Phaeosphaeria sp. MPI-PUGE-AT-0046c]
MDSIAKADIDLGSPKCYLLDLPGELRNRIYSFVREDNPVTFTSRPLFKSLSDDDIKAYGIDQRTPSFLGLTQTCHQLRKEYSPLYAAHTTIRVFHVDLKEVMRLNFPFLARDTDGNAIGNLLLVSIPWKIYYHLRRPTWIYPIIDALPLILYCGKHANFHVTYDYNVPRDPLKNPVRPGTEDGMKHLCDAAAIPKWQEWLNSSASVIELRYNDCYIRIIMKQYEGLRWDWSGRYLSRAEITRIKLTGLVGDPEKGRYGYILVQARSTYFPTLTSLQCTIIHKIACENAARS